MNTVVAALALLSVAGAGMLSLGAMAEVPSPMAQHEAGVPIHEIQCRDSKTLMETTRGTPACISEGSVQKLLQKGWVPVAQATERHDRQQPEAAKTGGGSIDGPDAGGGGDGFVVLSASSPVEFVDDGREIKRSTLARYPPPWPYYETIMDSDITPNDVGPDNLIRLPATQHEKYSITPGAGFHIEDWMPTYIPDGQRLLYADNTCYPSGNCSLKIQFVPTTFVLNENVTNYELKHSEGFVVWAEYKVVPLDEIEDTIEHIKEVFGSQYGNYGEGFREMTRDGKTVAAFEGGNALNHYRAFIIFHHDEHTLMSVNSRYHTLDELLPVFNSLLVK